MEVSRPRRHSLGTAARRSTAVSVHHAGEAFRVGSVEPAKLQTTAGATTLPSEDRKASEASRAGSSVSSSSTSKRRRSSGGRRWKNGSADFSFSPYQPMIIETVASSLSPRPRRASAPVPPASLLLHKHLIAGEQQQQQRGTGGGPTLDQCLVLPPGLALKIEGLLATSRSQDGDGGSDGIRSGGGKDGGDGDGSDDRANTWNYGMGEEGKNRACPPQRARGRRAGSSDRAIISSFHFETSGSPAVVGVGGGRGEHLEEDEAAAARDISTTFQDPGAMEATREEFEDSPVAALADGGAPQDRSRRSGSGDSSNEAHYNGINSDDSPNIEHRADEDQAPLQEPPGGQTSSPEKEAVGVFATGYYRGKETAAAVAAPDAAGDAATTAAAEIEDAPIILSPRDERDMLVDTTTVSNSRRHRSAAAGRSIIANGGDPVAAGRSCTPNEACFSAQEGCSLAIKADADTGRTMKSEADWIGEPGADTQAEREPDLRGNIDGEERLASPIENRQAADDAPRLNSRDRREVVQSLRLQLAGSEASYGNEGSPLPSLVSYDSAVLFSYDSADSGYPMDYPADSSPVLETGETSAVDELRGEATCRESSTAVDGNVKDGLVGGRETSEQEVTAVGFGAATSASATSEGVSWQEREGGDEGAGTVSEMGVTLVDDGTAPKVAEEDRGECGKEGVGEASDASSGAAIAAEREGSTSGEGGEGEVQKPLATSAVDGEVGNIVGGDSNVIAGKVVTSEDVKDDLRCGASTIGNQRRGVREEQGSELKEESSSVEHLTTGNRQGEATLAGHPGLLGGGEEDAKEEEKGLEIGAGANGGMDTGEEKREHGSIVRTFMENATASFSPSPSFSSAASDTLASNAAALPSPLSHRVSDRLVSSVELDSGTVTRDVAARKEEDDTAPPDWDVLAKEQEQVDEVPLDWEALAREVEAEWVMEGSGDESELSFSSPPRPVSPPASPAEAAMFSPRESGNDELALATAEGKPQTCVAVCLLEPSSACSQSQQQRRQEKEEEKKGGVETRGDGGVVKSQEPAPPPSTPPHPQGDIDAGDSGDRGGGGSDDAATSGYGTEFRHDENEAGGDCGSPVLPSKELQDSTPSRTDQRSSIQGSESQNSVHAREEEQASSIYISEGGITRSTVITEPPPAPGGPPGQPKPEAAAEVDRKHGDGDGALVGGNSGHREAMATVRAAGRGTVPAIHDGYVGGAVPPGRSEAQMGNGSRGGCARGSCGCVLM